MESYGASDKLYDEVDHLLAELVLNKEVCESEQVAASRIKHNTKRGDGNIRYKNLIMYSGSANMDRVVSVGTNQHGEYVAFIHPDAAAWIETVI